MKLSYFFVLLFLSITSSLVKAQNGTVFWFVAPDAIHAHGDEPLYFRVTTFEKAAKVTISMPANSGFKEITESIGANMFATIEVPRKSVENAPVDNINNKGLLIESTADITIYYEIADDGNPDKFTLKGENALGKEFFVPSQNAFANYSSYGGNANEKVDIVATEDNTEVTIIPTVNVTGHKKGVPYQITLNKGQTYCIEYRDISAAASMAGTQITADKPIAVTISDDSINETSHPHDIVGDQLIPTTVIGSEYIAVKTNTTQYGTQKVFVLGTEDDTHIFINNDKDLVRHVNKGELTSFDITGNAIYIKATRPVYAYQVSGLANILTSNHANELGSALLPTIECTGSSRVAFTRVFIRSFWVNILTQQKNISSFTMYDSDKNTVNFLDAVKWEKVEGTDDGSAEDTWYSAVINMELSTGTPYTIENTKGLFHLSVLDENDPNSSVGSVSYGYFSSYGRMHINGPSQECNGRVIELQTSVEMNDYNWYSLETGNAVLSKDRVLNVTKSGKYWVTAEVKHGGCVITDSLDVEFKMPDIELGNDTTVCPDQTVTYVLKEGYSKYEWSTSDTHHTTTINVGEGFAEKIEVEVTDEFGCTANDEVLVTAYATPDIQLNRTEVCMGQSVVHVNKFDRYRWEFKGAVLNEDETKDFIIPEESGIYTLTVWNEFGCSQTEDINITVHALPSLSLTDQWECNGVPTRIDATPVSGWNYEWSTGATTSYIDLSAPADFALKVTDANGCVAESKARFDWYDDPVVDLGDDLSECVGVTVNLVSPSGYSNYEWKYKKNEVDPVILLPTPSSPDVYEITNTKKEDSGYYIVNILDTHGCPATDTVKVDLYDTNPPVLELERDLCKGEEIEILATTGYDSYVWYRNGMALPAYDDLTAIKVNNDGTYKLEASYLGCIKQNKVTITAYDTPEVKLPDDFSICPGDDIILGIESFTSPSGSALDYFVWDGEEKKIGDIKAVKKVDAVGLYGVTAYDEHGCSDSDKVNVSNYSLTVVPDVAPIEACENIGVSLENPITDALSYKWFKVEADTDVAGPENVNWNVSQSGTYRLSIVDKNGCPSEREQVIKILPVPVVDLGPDVEMCAGESAVLKVPDVFASYEWNNNSLLNKSFLPVSTSGSYQLEVENIEGCSATDQVNVIIHPSPVFDVPDVAVCAGEEVTLNAPAGLSNIKWSTGETSSSIVADRGGYWLEAMSDEGCVTRDTVKVIWYPVPKADLGPDSLICPVDQLQISAGLGFASYLWHNNQTVPTITAALQDTVNQVIVSNEFGCYGFDTKLVRPMSRPDVVLCSDTSVCEKDTFDIIPDVSSFEDDEYVSPEPFSYLWDDGSTEETRQVVEPGEYIVEVTDGCFVFRDTAEVVYEELPIITHIDSTVYGKITVLAEGGTAPYEYILNESDISSDGVFSKLEPGEHIVEVVDANGCKALDSLSLSELVEIEIPPFFTPNGDGINDRFVIKGSERFPDAIIKIYDRYGKLLVKYPASSPGWDGRYEGRPVSTDDYWYVVEFVSSRKILKGHVTLKR